VIFLLDTHLLFWGLARPDSIPAKATRLIRDPGNQLVFSVVSVWEVAIKQGAAHDDFDLTPRQFREALLSAGVEELAVLGTHAVAVGSLPRIHKDPFDRLLIAQAMTERLTLLTADSTVARYPGPIRKV
jgi:PIN domain nuclease of toxin-antitoxin system